MIDVDVSVDIKQALGVVNRFSNQVPFAAAVALTRTAQEGAQEMKTAFVKSFDRQTRYTLNSIFSDWADLKKSGPNNLKSSFGLKDNALIQKSGGYTPSSVLGHHFEGGQSLLTRYEKAFRRVGLLRANEDIVPGEEAPLDQYGNVPSSLIVRLISYFGAFEERGFRANSTKKTRADLAKKTGKNTKGKRKSKYVTINGVVYFYASADSRLTDHLHRGIWAKTGIHGVDIRPILMFVKRGVYRKRFDINTFANHARTNFAQHFDTAFKQAMASAR